MTTPSYLRALCTLLPLLPGAFSHMQMQDPSPLRDPHSDRADEPKDYNILAPLHSDGSDFTCKGYQWNTELTPTATYNAGETYNITLKGGATHGGGSCQISMSCDNGLNFKVLKSIMGGCPLSDTYSFTVPENAQSAQCLLAWTWFNKVGNREMYMNCAVVDVVGAGDKMRRTPSNQGRASTAESMAAAAQAALRSLPDLYVANLAEINDCKTKESDDPLFDNPGQDVEYGDGVKPSKSKSPRAESCTGVGRKSAGDSNPSPPSPPSSDHSDSSGHDDHSDDEDSDDEESDSVSAGPSYCNNGQWHPECVGGNKEWSKPKDPPKPQDSSAPKDSPKESPKESSKPNGDSPRPTDMSKDGSKSSGNNTKPTSNVEKELDRYLESLDAASSSSDSPRPSAAPSSKNQSKPDTKQNKPGEFYSVGDHSQHDDAPYNPGPNFDYNELLPSSNEDSESVPSSETSSASLDDLIAALQGEPAEGPAPTDPNLFLPNDDAAEADVPDALDTDIITEPDILNRPIAVPGDFPPAEIAPANNLLAANVPTGQAPDTEVPPSPGAPNMLSIGNAPDLDSSALPEFLQGWFTGPNNRQSSPKPKQVDVSGPSLATPPAGAPVGGSGAPCEAVTWNCAGCSSPNRCVKAADGCSRTCDRLPYKSTSIPTSTEAKSLQNRPATYAPSSSPSPSKLAEDFAAKLFNVGPPFKPAIKGEMVPPSKPTGSADSKLATPSMPSISILPIIPAPVSTSTPKTSGVPSMCPNATAGYATSNITSYLPCRPGTLLCRSETEFYTCGLSPGGTWAYGALRRVAAGMACKPRLDKGNAEIAVRRREMYGSGRWFGQYPRDNGLPSHDDDDKAPKLDGETKAKVDNLLDQLDDLTGDVHSLLSAVQASKGANEDVDRLFDEGPGRNDNPAVEEYFSKLRKKLMSVYWKRDWEDSYFSDGSDGGDGIDNDLDGLFGTAPTYSVGDDPDTSYLFTEPDSANVNMEWLYGKERKKQVLPTAVSDEDDGDNLEELADDPFQPAPLPQEEPAEEDAPQESDQSDDSEDTVNEDSSNDSEGQDDLEGSLEDFYNSFGSRLRKRQDDDELIDGDESMEFSDGSNGGDGLELDAEGIFGEEASPAFEADQGSEDTISGPFLDFLLATPEDETGEEEGEVEPFDSDEYYGEDDSELYDFNIGDGDALGYDSFVAGDTDPPLSDGESGTIWPEPQLGFRKTQQEPGFVSDGKRNGGDGTDNAPALLFGDEPKDYAQKWPVVDSQKDSSYVPSALAFAAKHVRPMLDWKASRKQFFGFVRRMEMDDPPKPAQPAQSGQPQGQPQAQSAQSGQPQPQPAQSAQPQAAQSGQPQAASPTQAQTMAGKVAGEMPPGVGGPQGPGGPQGGAQSLAGPHGPPPREPDDPGEGTDDAPELLFPSLVKPNPVYDGLEDPNSEDAVFDSGYDLPVETETPPPGWPKGSEESEDAEPTDAPEESEESKESEAPEDVDRTEEETNPEGVSAEAPPENMAKLMLASVRNRTEFGSPPISRTTTIVRTEEVTIHVVLATSPPSAEPSSTEVWDDGVIPAETATPGDDFDALAKAWPGLALPGPVIPSDISVEWPGAIEATATNLEVMPTIIAESTEEVVPEPVFTEPAVTETLGEQPIPESLAPEVVEASPSTTEPALSDIAQALAADLGASLPDVSQAAPQADTPGVDAVSPDQSNANPEPEQPPAPAPVSDAAPPEPAPPVQEAQGQEQQQQQQSTQKLKRAENIKSLRHKISRDLHFLRREIVELQRVKQGHLKSMKVAQTGLQEQQQRCPAVPAGYYRNDQYLGR